jgi:hypothetical protein
MRSDRITFGLYQNLTSASNCPSFSPENPETIVALQVERFDRTDLRSSYVCDRAYRFLALNFRFHDLDRKCSYVKRYWR